MRTGPHFYKELMHHLIEGVYFINQAHVITYWNKTAEEISGYTESEMLHKGCGGNVFQHLDESATTLCPQSCPLKKVAATKLPLEMNAFLQHKEGYRIPIRMKLLPIHDEQDEIIGVVNLFQKNSPLYNREQVQVLAKLAYYDEVTRLLNRQYAETQVQSALETSRKTDLPFGLLLIQLTSLQEINEVYGMTAGNALLKTAAATLSHTLEHPDSVYRWQGPRFLLLAPNKRKSSLMLLANKIKLLLQQSAAPIDVDTQVPIAVRIGGVLSSPSDTLEVLLTDLEKAVSQSEHANNAIYILE